MLFPFNEFHEWAEQCTNNKHDRQVQTYAYTNNKENMDGKTNEKYFPHIYTKIHITYIVKNKMQLFLVLKIF